METLRLEATIKGFVSQFFWAALWDASLLLTALWCSAQINAVYTLYRVTSLSQYYKRTFSYDRQWYMDPPFLHLAMWALLCLFVVIVLVNVWTLLYTSRQVDVYTKDDSGRWMKCVSTSYGFPFSKNVYEATFDRVLSVEVQQGSIDRILGTGTLSVTATLYLSNGETESELDFSISGIVDPYAAKARLEGAFAQYAGMKLSLAQ